MSEIYRCLLEPLASENLFGGMADKSILITGATGLIGTALVDSIMYANDKLGLDIKVYAMSLRKRDVGFRFGEYLQNPLFQYVQQDLSKPIETNLPPVHYIIHAAGYGDPLSFAQNPVDVMTTNFIGTYNLLEYGRAHHLEQFIYISSGEVYGTQIDSVTSFTEEYMGYIDNLLPRSCYPLAKRASETLCAAYDNQYNIPFNIVRPCHIYGPTQTRRDSRAVAQFIRNGLAGQDIVLKSSGEQVRSYCFVIDAVEAIWIILKSGVLGSAYNIANTHVSILELAHTVATTTGTKVVMDLSCKENEQKEFPFIVRGVLSAKKLEKLGWTPRSSLDLGVTNTLDVMRDGYANR